MSASRPPTRPLLIRGAELHGAGRADVRIRDGRIAALGALIPSAEETVIDARGGALLPGLHDHHIHLLSYAASRESLHCGPPEIGSEVELVRALQRHREIGPDAWIRGYGYHESVAGELDRFRLDRWVADVPVRIQHRSGRLWVLNSAAITRLTQARDGGNARPPPLTGLASGRLYDQDAALRQLLPGSIPDVAAASRDLARCGVTGLTDMTPDNDARTLELFRELQRCGSLRQRVYLAGSAALDPLVSLGGRAEPTSQVAATAAVGPTKLHLHEEELPPFQDFCETIAHSHRAGRTVAVHCVTETELVYTLAAYREAGILRGDRIEHASVTPPALLEQLEELGLLVVTQPNFVAERGDAYRRELAAAAHPWLYRCRSFLARGIPLAAGTDAPFGSADPWYAMRAATRRETRDGALLGPDERLSADEALALFLGTAAAPEQPRRIRPGAVADLCLLDRPWRAASRILSADCVRATLRDGTLIYDGIDEPPLESSFG